MGLRLSVVQISKRYHGTPVLEDCTFSFNGGGSYVLMGSNGSGKSTFLRICALLEDPDSGEVTYRAEAGVIRKDLELQRRITLVLPRIGLFNTTVFNNVAYGLKIRGIKRSDLNERVYRALDFVGMSHKSEQNALTLSSGETQRVGIARAIVIEPEVLFLDEPTAFVDHESKKIIEAVMLEMKRDIRSTVIIATHDETQAERLADRILQMKEGRIMT